MKKLILHIPHSSTNIPDKTGYLVKEDIIQSEILKLTDWHTSELFHSENAILVKANFSRIFCDVERFKNDDDEVMAKFGMGVLYEQTDDGKPLREVSVNFRQRIIEEYYMKHHDLLDKAVTKQIDINGRALILDCHSFPDIPLNRDLDKELNRPDFNLGTDHFHTPNKIIDESLSFFKDRGFTIVINRPYSGTIVPLEYYMKDKNVQSLMLEVNRRLYLKNETNQKTSNYQPIKVVVGEYIEMLNRYLDNS